MKCVDGVLYLRRYLLLVPEEHSCHPTVCRSAAASAPQRAYQKANDLAREAVSWNGGLDGTGSHTTALRVGISGKHLPYDCCNLLSKQLIALGREVQPILA
jgi:hypothetical protein